MDEFFMLDKHKNISPDNCTALIFPFVEVQAIYYRPICVPNERITRSEIWYAHGYENGKVSLDYTFIFNEILRI
jgi:hypothetical protein